MSFSLSSLDVHYLVKELRPLIEESFVDKVYQGQDEKGEFLFRLRSPKAGKQQLFIKVPDALFLTEHRYQWPQQPAGFCMQLRKHLGNAQLMSIHQHGFERIVEIVFRKGEVEWKLIIELFSKGNVVLVNQEGLIRGVMDLQRWKDRTLRVNAPYEYPPGARGAPEMSIDELAALLESDERDLVRFCATALGLGGKYAEELVARTGLGKHEKGLSRGAVERLHQELLLLFAAEPSPVASGDDAAPFPLKAWPDALAVGSFSVAIESLVVAQKVSAIDDSKDQAVSKEKGKWQRIIDEQSLQVAGYRKSAEENQRKGEFIYEQYQALKLLLETIASLHAKNGWGAVKGYVLEKKLPVLIDEKKATITIEMKE